MEGDGLRAEGEFLFLVGLCQERLENRVLETALVSCRSVCVCFLPIHSGHQVRWTYQPGSHRRKITQDFSSIFFLRCVP